jgi:hypothetical protein
LNDKSADIVFKVGGGKRKDNAMKVAKITPVTFPAHPCIVHSGAISKIESLDFCAISESESNVFPFKFVCDTHHVL